MDLYTILSSKFIVVLERQIWHEVYFQEIKRVGWPVPHTLIDEDTQEVVYIDHDHLHMVGDVDTGADANF